MTRSSRHSSKTLEEANIITTTHDLTSTQFECLRAVMLLSVT